MPRVEGTLAVSEPAGGDAVFSERVLVHGWGGGQAAAVERSRPGSVEGLESALALARARLQQPASSIALGAIVRGLGRSYGDAAQLTGGTVLDVTRLKGMELDHERGVVNAMAGVSLAELLERLVPAGWLVPVLPGTQHVTVGGAIASDIHGKNHGTAGTFGTHLRSLELLSATGELLHLEPGDELFQATLGGMGLTGVIVSAQIALRPVSGPLLAVDTDRVNSLEDALAVLASPGGSYRVAWLDLLANSRGRGIVTRAELLAQPPLDPAEAMRAARLRQAPATVKARAQVPSHWPSGLVRVSSLRAFNELRFRTAPRQAREHVEPIGTHMFPLDKLDHWPRLYGPRGFVQYQLVVPRGAESVLEDVIDELRRGQVPCFLAVLKDFGPANRAPLSFPIEGWTLALDLPRAAAALYPTLDRCDEHVAGAGGRIYLSKDARMRPGVLAAMYPQLKQWQAARNRVDPERLWRSDLALRVGLIEAAE
jgi:decaprenylphospho-beta-D-ribofuranose 2-oxidase